MQFERFIVTSLVIFSILIFAFRLTTTPIFGFIRLDKNLDLLTVKRSREDRITSIITNNFVKENGIPINISNTGPRRGIRLTNEPCFHSKFILHQCIIRQSFQDELLIIIFLSLDKFLQRIFIK